MEEIIKALKQQKMSIRQLSIKVGRPYSSTYDLIHRMRLPLPGEVEKIRKALWLEKPE